MCRQHTIVGIWFNYSVGSFVAHIEKFSLNLHAHKSRDSDNIRSIDCLSFSKKIYIFIVVVIAEMTIFECFESLTTATRRLFFIERLSELILIFYSWILHETWILAYDSLSSVFPFIFR